MTPNAAKLRAPSFFRQVQRDALRPWLLAGALAAGSWNVSHAAAATRIEKPLVVVSNPPPVQMLVPGFEVAELPVTLNNVKVGTNGSAQIVNITIQPLIK